ncbi:porin [Paraburkholderia dilworthii]|uniref:Porin n=1 Tax=Paraburkholderia dilworthii TaxID=948106 RepID=A0ABW9D1A3_9BURK
MKRLFGVVLAVGCCSAQAQSSVTLYGVIDEGLGYTNNEGGHSVAFLKSGNVFGSRWGLKGQEDLGGGLSTVFMLESGFSAATGASLQGSRLFGRNAYVGLSSDNAGRVLLGRQYDMGTQLVAGLAGYPITGVSDTPGDLDGRDGVFRINNSIAYLTPNWNGFSAGALYAFGGVAGSTGSQNAFSLGANYQGGLLAAGVAYTRFKNADNTPAWTSAAVDSPFTYAINQGFATTNSIGVLVSEVSLTLGGLQLGAGYSNVQYKPSSTSLFHKTATFNIGILSAQYLITPALSVRVADSYTQGTSLSSATGQSYSAAKYNQISVGFDYFLSKSTSLYLRTGYQRSTGYTLAADGHSIVNAAADIGDVEGGAAAAPNGKQFTARVGIAKKF